MDAWFYETLAGIRIDETHPGFEQVHISPYVPEELNSAEASVRTHRGVVTSG